MRADELVVGDSYYADIDDCCVIGRVFVGEYYGEREYRYWFQNGDFETLEGATFSHAGVVS